jgi:hypothetical protein
MYLVSYRSWLALQHSCLVSVSRGARRDGIASKKPRRRHKKVIVGEEEQV